MAQRTQRTYARLKWQGTDPALESCRCLNVGWALQGPEPLTDLQLDGARVLIAPLFHASSALYPELPNLVWLIFSPSFLVGRVE